MATLVTPLAACGGDDDEATRDLAGDGGDKTCPGPAVDAVTAQDTDCIRETPFELAAAEAQAIDTDD